MKYGLCLLIALLGVIGCGKDDSKPSYDCSVEDRSQGVFEQWDEATKKFVAYSNVQVTSYPDTEIGVPLRYLALSSDKLTHDSSIVLSYVTNVAAACYFTLSFRESIYPIRTGAISEPHTLPSDTFRLVIENYEPWRSGCAMLHYVFVDKLTGVVFTKGHYRIAISQ